MIQIGKFGNPGIKIFEGYPAPIDHRALFKRGRFAFQDFANRLGDNSARTDRFGQQARPNDITDRKDLGV